MSLFFWAWKEKLPPNLTDDHVDTRLVEAWILGHKYDLKVFQDLVMEELLWMLDVCLTDLSAARPAFFKTPPGSKLRILMAEEIALLLMDEPQIKISDLSDLGKVDGFQAELMAALKQQHLHGYGGDRMKRKEGGEEAPGERFMVSDDP